MPRAIILGSGTSNGIPMLGYRYPDGYLDNPKNHRTRSSLLLQGPTGNFLVDCAPEMRLQLVHADVYDLEAVLITHTHADHIMGMDDLRSLCIKTGQPMPIYTLGSHQQDIRRVFPYAFLDFPPGIWVPRFEFRDVPPVIHECGMAIRTFLVEHGSTTVIGVRVNNFAYITDVSGIPSDSMEVLKDLDVLVLDAVRKTPHPNHFHFEKALQVADEIGAEKTYLTHLSHDYDHDVTNSALPCHIQLSFDGLVLEI